MIIEMLMMVPRARANDPTIRRANEPTIRRANEPTSQRSDETDDYILIQFESGPAHFGAK